MLLLQTKGKRAEQLESTWLSVTVVRVLCSKLRLRVWVFATYSEDFEALILDSIWRGVCLTPSTELRFRTTRSTIGRWPWRVMGLSFRIPVFLCPPLGRLFPGTLPTVFSLCCDRFRDELCAFHRTEPHLTSPLEARNIRSWRPVSDLQSRRDS